jgi:hypothetical protein
MAGLSTLIDCRLNNLPLPTWKQYLKNETKEQKRERLEPTEQSWTEYAAIHNRKPEHINIQMRVKHVIVKGEAQEKISFHRKKIRSKNK